MNPCSMDTVGAMSGSPALGHIDVVRPADLQELASHDGPCVSIFLPTARHGPDTLEGPVRLTNLLRQVEADLEPSDIDRATIDQVLGPLRALVDDAPFWQHQSDGLALYASATLNRRFRVPLSFADSAVVGSRFRLLPLWSLVAGDGVFFIVSLSQNEVRVFEATSQTIDEVAPGPVPRSLAEALAHEDPERQLQSRSVGGSDVQYHGHGAGSETDKATLERYFRAVDKGVTALLGPTRHPVVLACVDYYLPIFQSVSKLANLADAVITGNPEHRTPDELLAAARPIIEPMQATHRAAIAERFAALAGTGKTLTDVAEIVTAADQGRVDTLLVRSDGFASGEQPPEVAESLTDLAVADVLATGGTIAAIEHIVATGTPIAAILRY
jgi:HAMP domain-containing protein